MTKPVYHMVHYRRFKRAARLKPQKTFEQMCRDMLSSQNKQSLPLWERAHDRVFIYPEPDDRQILLNKVADLTSAVFGEMCLMQAKDLQALIEMKARKVQLSNITNAEIYWLSERSAPNGSQFIRGMLYWLAIGDHLFFVRLNSMTSVNMQDYFSWLLKELTGEMEVSFQAEFDPSVVNGDVGDVSNLRIKGKTAPQIKITAHSEDKKKSVVQTTRHVAERFIESAMAIPVVKAVLGEAHTESLMNSLGPEEYLSVDAAVKVRGKRTAESRAKIREIATEVADMTDAEVQIDGKDGAVRDGDAILRVRMPFSTAQDGSNLLDFNNVADQLQEVYRRFVKDRKITS